MARPIAQVWLLGVLAAASLALWTVHAPRPAHAARPAVRLGAAALPLSRRPDGAWFARTRPLLVRPSAPLPHLVAYVRRTVALRARPFGPVVARLGTRTQFGSPQALSVVRASSGGRWLAVTTPELANRTLGWVDARAGGLAYARTRLALEIDLSRRVLLVRSGRRVLRSASVGIGRPGSPTPTGRFAVTDKLDGAAINPVYGCCILALSAHQTNVPAGWRGGDRMAIHAGPLGAVSAGCVHAAEGDLRYLMRLVPLGTPVTIRP